MTEVTVGEGRHRVIQWSRIRVKSASGSWIEDETGRRLLDFFGAAGVNLVGHCHPEVTRQVSKAFGSLGIGAFPNDFEQRLQAQFTEILPQGSWNLELFSGGAEAVEAALRACEEHTGFQSVVGLSGGFHGKTRGARSVTQGATPTVDGVPFAPFPDCARCPLGLHAPQCELACADTLREILATHAPRIGGVIVEVVQGRSGNLVLPDGYLRRIRRITQQTGTLLVLDETMTGLGRTGRWFAHDDEDIEPDLIIIGKGLGGGYPVSALIGKQAVMRAGSFGVPSGNSSSYGGFPTASAAASATITTLTDQNLITRCARMGDLMLNRLRAGLNDCPTIDRVTGRGLAVGVHLDQEHRNDAALRRFFDHCTRRGVLVMLGDRCIRLYPPLTVTEEELAIGCSAVIAAAWALAEGR